MNERLEYLDQYNVIFPNTNRALKHPDGLLAVGGNLNTDTLIKAYMKGIFPWFNSDDPILWWSPDPRMVLVPGKAHISRSLRKLLKKELYKVTFDRAFNQVICECAKTRQDAEGTWITQQMQEAYKKLHIEGSAHSIEIWNNDTLAGGLYGVSIGRVFYAESMFSLAPNTSKIAMVALSEQLKAWRYELIDCQVYSSHVESMGAKLISRNNFTRILDDYCLKPPIGAHWIGDWQWNDHSL